MTRLCLEKFKDTHEIVVTFANTGCEHANTLRFIRDCDNNLGFNTVWLEAVVGGKGTGIRHRVVTYETASRNGEPFEAYIAKYGIPSSALPQCTSRLKTEVMESYLKSIGWRRGKKLNYQTAIGIRADEIDRMSSKAKENGFIYPLVEYGYTKEQVLNEMRQYAWDLNIPGEHYGNCVWCWKKSFRKLMTLAQASPEVFDFPKRMEEKYSNHKVKSSPRRFFRGQKTVGEIFEMSKQPFEKFRDSITPDNPAYNAGMDVGSGCSESCEIGADE